ncbi:MAG: hypothetical protein GAK37_03485 [Pseudomonas sp.]|nr:MAG: hypothetical protein GAK37_03485 [Pseudomonas sp.]
MHDVKETHVAVFRVSGLKVRTRNTDESAPGRGKIGPMWGQFFGEGMYEKIPGKQVGSPVYGVYSAYESDADGLFDVSAAVATDGPAPGFESQVIQAGAYRVFEARGAMREAIIQTWQQIWSCFQQPGAPARAYATDFEAYVGDDLVLIHIGLLQEAAGVSRSSN